MDVLSHLARFVELFYLHARTGSGSPFTTHKGYRAYFSLIEDEARKMELRDSDCPMFADYSVARQTLPALAGAGDEWKDCPMNPTYFKKSPIKNARNFNGPQPSRAFFRAFATPRFDPERNKTILLRPREALFFLAQYRDHPPFPDRRTLRFPSTTADGRTIRYVAPCEEQQGDWTTAPTKATLAFVDPNVPLAENEFWLLVNQVICL